LCFAGLPSENKNINTKSSFSGNQDSDFKTSVVASIKILGGAKCLILGE